VRLADLLRQTPAAVRFISAEPLLGPLVERCPEQCGEVVSDNCYACNSTGWTGLDLTGIDWLVLGGESGPKHRPMDPQWELELIEAARAAGTKVFVKQASGPRPGMQGDLPDWAFALREYPT
jgi:protein gp37